MEAKMRRTIFSLLISIAWPFFLGPHCLSAQETSQLPDVWVREFVDYADDRLHIAAIDEKEVLVWQSLKADENGEPVRDSQGDTVNLEKGLLFFQGAVVTPQEHGEIFMRLGNDLATIARTNSCRIMQAHDAQRGSYSTSAGYQRLSDGGALRWFNDIAKREGWRRDFGPWRTERHTTDYNYISALERTDPNGAVVWQRVYLYFHPWWSERTGSLVNDFTHCFFYFKRGCLALVDESRVFLSFGGTRKIYRLDSNGLPKTDDKRLVVVDQGEYMRLVREVIESIDEWQSRVGKSPRQSIDPCVIAGVGEDGRREFLGDYDYIGEVLARRLGFDPESEEVRRIRDRRLGAALRACAEAYHRIGKE